MFSGVTLLDSDAAVVVLVVVVEFRTVDVNATVLARLVLAVVTCRAPLVLEAVVDNLVVVIGVLGGNVPEALPVR